MLGTQPLSKVGSRFGPKLETLQLLKADHCATGNDNNDDNRYAHTFWLSSRDSPAKSDPFKFVSGKCFVYTFYIKHV